MTGRMSPLAIALAVACVAGVSLPAQQTSTTSETKNFRVIEVEGNDLVVSFPEGTRELTVPEDFRFTVNGQPLSVHELKPGMRGTATITTRTTVIPVTVTEVKNGTVMQRSGSSIIVRTADGIKMFSEGDLDKRGVKMMKDGQPAQLADFREGDKLTATIITSKPPKVMTEKEVRATTAPAATAQNAAGASSRSAAASSSSSSMKSSSPKSTSAKSSSALSSTSAANSQSAAPGQSGKTLPKTASSWPLLALASILSLAIGLALTVARRFVF